LPDIGGRQLWDELHDHSVYTAKPLIPALFIDTPVPVRSMGELSLDMEDAIAKPYDIEEVRLRVQNLIRAKQQFDRHRSSDNDLKTKGDQS
jgi:DNA-binding response OmpR family regulator